MQAVQHQIQMQAVQHQIQMQAAQHQIQMQAAQHQIQMQAVQHQIQMQAVQHQIPDYRQSQVDYHQSSFDPPLGAAVVAGHLPFFQTVSKPSPSFQHHQG